MDPDPDSDPDPAILVIDLQDASKNYIYLSAKYKLPILSLQSLD